MSYPVNHFLENKETILRTFIEHFPLANLICAENNEIYTSYLPLLWKGKDELVGHLDKQNPQVKLLKNGKQVKVVFNGPAAYISPSHFDTNELPTFNYCKVEVVGEVCTITEAMLKEEIISLTKLLEKKEAAYQLTKDEERLHHLVHYIYGFKIKIKHIQGRFKMSQDKSLQHQQKVIKVMQHLTSQNHSHFFETLANRNNL